MERTVRMRKLDIAFAIALIIIIVLFGAGLLVVQRSHNTVFYWSSGTRTAVPVPEWTRYEEAEVSA